MKKLLFAVLASALLFSCGGNSGSGLGGSSAIIPEKFDYKLLTDEAEVKKIADEVIAKVGDNMSKLDKIDIWITRPSKEGSIKRDKPDYAMITTSFLNPNDPKKLFEYRYSSERGGWDNGESKSVRLVTGNAESFVLADEMYDASAVTSDLIVSAVKEGWEKYKDEEKFSEQWVKGIIIKNGTIEVAVRGILAANDLEKSHYHKVKIKK